MYSKEEQLKWNKPKKVKKSKRITNDDELKYLNWAKQQMIPCFVCGSYDTQLHHIKERSSDVKNHYEIIPLCIQHHLGNEMSPHGTSRKFREMYPIAGQREYAKKIKRTI